MKLSVLQENLKRGLSIVGHAVAGKSTLPVLSNVLLATDGGRLKLAATNLEISITYFLGAKVEGEGSVTLPAKLLSDVVGGLPNDTVAFVLNDTTQTMSIKCGRFEANVHGIESDEFPVIPTVTGEATITFKPAALREAIEQVAFAAATDDTRPVLTGVLLRVRGNVATFAAADGFRLAVKTITLPETVAEPLDVIIPARALIELSRIIGDVEGDVTMGVTATGGQVAFKTESIELVSRLIEGKFPDFERIIPAQFTTRTVLETAELAKSVKLASYFANASANIIKIVLEDAEPNTMYGGRVTISANAAEVGDNRSAINGILSGEGGEIAVNVKFLTEAIAAMKTAQVAIETQTPQSPLVMKPVGTEGYTHIVMPMTVK